MILNMDIPIEIIIGAAVFVLVLFLAVVFLGTYYMDIRSKHPELHVLQTARKKPFPPVICMVDPSDKMLMFNGIKEKKTDIKLKKGDYGLLFDPYQTAQMPKSRLEDGTGMFMYGVGFHFPVSPNGARTIVQFINKIRKEYPKLNFIRDDIVLLELFTKSGTDLRKDIVNVLKMYPLENPIIDVDASNRISDQALSVLSEEERIEYFVQQQIKESKITVDEIAEMIEDSKGKTKGWKIESGWFSIHDGISLLPIGTMSSDMARLETVTKMNTANDLMKEPDQWMNTLKFIAIVGGMLILAWMIITAMKPGAPT